MSMDRFREIERRLESIYRDAAEPKELRRRVLEAAVRSPRDWQRGAIGSAWASGDPEWRITARQWVDFWRRLPRGRLGRRVETTSTRRTPSGVARSTGPATRVVSCPARAAAAAMAKPMRPLDSLVR